jgi:hypothetical protein
MGQANTETSERQPSKLRTWLKRCRRRTLCGSKTARLLACVLGLCIHRSAVGRLLDTMLNPGETSSIRDIITPLGRFDANLKQLYFT